MKKNQSKSKVESRKSVANQCDYSRMNGKCGRALSENFGKPCPGRSCEDWKCDAEGEESKSEVEVEQRKSISRCDGMRKDGTCGNGCSDNHNKKCRGVKCPDCFQHAVAVVEPTGAVVPSDQDAVALFREQMGRIKAAEGNLQFERIKFGVILIRWEQYLGDGRGCGKGHGLKGWLETNLKELPYETAHGYKQQALQAVRYVQGENAAEIPVQVAQAALLGEEKVEQPDGKVIDVPSEVIEAKNDLMENATSRRKLVQMYFNALKPEFQGKSGKKAGISKGMKADTSGAAVDTTDVYAAARAVWSKVIKEAQATAALKAAAKLLKEADVEDALTVLGDLVDILKERQKVLKSR